ncbi:MAG: hypothetical protein MI862_17885 [Desulfobacterales bacterium]|nr:hypothetical protein [Desulfobacterales bacterium]
MENYLPALKKQLKTGNIDSAKHLLADLSSKQIDKKLEVLKILALAPDKTALQLLSFLTDSKNRDPDIYDRLIQLVIDRAHLNFSFVLILFENADSKTISQVIPLVRHILSNETDRDLLNKIIRTAGKLRIDRLTDDIAEFIFYDDPALKSEAIRALERIDTPRSCDRLIQASKTEKCDEDILDAVQVLSAKQKEESISAEPVAVEKPVKIEEKKLSEPSEPKLDDLTCDDIGKRFQAFSAFSRMEPEYIAGLFKSPDLENHDLTILLLQLIKRSIPLSAVLGLLDILSQKKIDSTVKFAAYSALESYPELKSAASVTQALSEPTLFVRIAALRVLNKNLSDFVLAEIRNKIESGTKKGETLAENILDSRSEHIIEQLMISDTFSYIASNYLARSAPIPCLDTFIRILEQRNLKSTARKYTDLKQQRTAQVRPQIIMISSNEAVLATYGKLISACGFDACGFRRPQEAFESFISEKPSAILCDLFLDEMTGLDIAGEIRELYSAEEVPFIISTLQKDLDKKGLKPELEKAGVNAICDFPAKTNQIKSWIK